MFKAALLYAFVRETFAFKGKTREWRGDLPLFESVILSTSICIVGDWQGASHLLTATVCNQMESIVAFVLTS